MTPASLDGQRGTESRPGLLTRLRSGPVICAEGYLFELERRGYLQAGPFVPEVVLDHPEQVTALHEQFVHAGSDVVEAFTYYAHREKLRFVGKEGLLEPMNRQALALAKQVAHDTGTLLAGNICNTNVYDPDDAASPARVRDMFAEQVGWAADAGADFVVAETFSFATEALLACEVIGEVGLPAVVTLAVHREPTTREGWSLPDACRRLEQTGATVVGLNCTRGPATMLPLLAQIVPAVGVPVAGLPVPYRTSAERPNFQALQDQQGVEPPTGRSFPTGLDPFTCTRYDVADFTRKARDGGVSYLGLCCGAGPHHIRAMAEALGRRPPASRYSSDMSRHIYFGDASSVAHHNQGYSDQLVEPSVEP